MCSVIGVRELQFGLVVGTGGASTGGHLFSLENESLARGFSTSSSNECGEARVATPNTVHTLCHQIEVESIARQTCTRAKVNAAATQRRPGSWIS